MSWSESVQSELVIKTGDGKEFRPLWKNNCAKEIEYNIAQFDFPKVQGSKIDRGTPMARKFSLEIYFSGDNNLDDSLSFEISSRDPRPWTISHPIYGNILVQPVSLKFDYSAFNVTQVTGTVLETLGSAGLQIIVIPEDKIVADVQELNEITAESFNADMELLRARELNPSDITSRDLAFSTRQITKLNGISQTLYDFGVKAVKTTEDAGKYLNIVNEAYATINLGIGEAQAIMTSMQAVVNFPAQIVNSVKVRVEVLQNQFDSLREQIGNIVNLSDKKNHEAVNASIVSAMCLAMITNTDYNSKTDVLEQITNIQDMRDTFLSDLDSLQTDNAGDEDSYIPTADVINALDDLVNFTIQNLYTIALSAKQERIIILEADSNVIILAHRFYGLLVDDSTIEQLINNNKIFLNELLQIRKGRTLSFYI